MFRKYFFKILIVLTILIIGIIVYFQRAWIAPKKEISRLEAEIENTIHTEADEVASCEIIAIGSKACGGPESYKVYSSKTTDVAKLNELNLQYLKAVQKFNKQNNMMSTCDVPVPPKTNLVNGHCVSMENNIQL